MDEVARAVSTAFTLSNDLRRDTELTVLFVADPPPKARRIDLVGARLRFLNPDERSTAALLKNALVRSVDFPRPFESSPGLTVSPVEPVSAVRAFLAQPNPLWLSEDGAPYRGVDRFPGVKSRRSFPTRTTRPGRARAPRLPRGPARSCRAPFASDEPGGRPGASSSTRPPRRTGSARRSRDGSASPAGRTPRLGRALERLAHRPRAKPSDDCGQAHDLPRLGSYPCPEDHRSGSLNRRLIARHTRSTVRRDRFDPPSRWMSARGIAQDEVEQRLGEGTCTSRSGSLTCSSLSNSVETPESFRWIFRLARSTFIWEGCSTMSTRPATRLWR